MYRNYRNKGKNDKDILDQTEALGRLMVKAHGAGGMPLVLSFLGLICLIFTFAAGFSGFAPVYLVVIFSVLATALLAAGIYLHVTKRPELCPKCHSELVKKNGKFGPFIGCSKYPDCDFKKSV